MKSLRSSGLAGLAKGLYGKLRRFVPRAYHFVVFKGHQLIADLIGLFVAFCTICAPLLKKIDDALGVLPPGHPARKELKGLRNKVADTDARLKSAEKANPGNFDRTPFDDEVQSLGKELDDLATRHPELADAIAPNKINPAKLLDDANDTLSGTGSVVHKNVPDYPGSGPTRGVVKHGDVEVPLKSGETGPGNWLIENLEGGKGSGLTRSWTHVEGHTAGLMRKHGIMDADLFINQVPCHLGAAKCRHVLHKLLPPGAKLRVHFPNEAGGVGTWLFEGGVPGWKAVK